MADSSATFAVDLEAGDDSATGQLEALREKILQDTAALREMKTALRNLQGGSNVDISQFKALKDQIDATKASIAQNQSSLLNMGGTFGRVAKTVEGGAAEAAGGAKGAAQAIRALGGSLKLVDGQAAGFGRKLASVVQNLGKAGMAGVIAIVVVALVVLAAALVAAAVAFAKFAIAAADASRNQRITLEEMGMSAEAAKRTQQSMDELRRATGISVDDQVKALQKLKEAHIKLSDEARRAVAIAQAGGGDEAVKRLIQEMQNGKSAAQALADAQAKYGKIVQEKMLGLDNQMANLHQDISDLFKDIAVEPFLKALHSLLQLFSQNTAFGRALHVIITAIGNKLVGWATAAIPHIVSGMKTVLIWALKGYIAINKFLNSDTGKALITVLKILAVVIGVVIAASGLALAFLTAMFALPIAGIALLIAGISQVIAWIEQLWNTASQAFGGIGSAVGNALGAVTGFVGEFISAGASLVQGLIDGVVGAAGGFIGALVNIAKSGIDAVKGALGIHSPSKVFAKIGLHTAAGLSEGMDAGAPDVASSAGGMAAAAVGGASAAPSGGGSSPGGARTYNITINGVKGAEQLQTPSFLAQLAAAIEQVTLETGGAPA